MSDTTRLEEWLRTVVSEYEYADGDSMAEDAAALLEELHALRTQWAAIPWAALRDPELFDNSATIGAWIRAEAPKENTNE